MKNGFFHDYFAQSSALIAELESLAPEVERAARVMNDCLSAGGKIIWFGNGGSATDAQHLSAELMGRFAFDRAPIASLALNSDSSLLTALGNDYGFEHVFSRQIQGICNSSDVCVGITTSGQSRNVLNGLQAARLKGAFVIALTSIRAMNLEEYCDLVLRVPSSTTSHIQEAHIVIGQAICAEIERVQRSADSPL